MVWVNGVWVHIIKWEYLLCFMPVVVVIDCSIYLSPDTYNPMRTNGIESTVANWTLHSRPRCRRVEPAGPSPRGPLRRGGQRLDRGGGGLPAGRGKQRQRQPCCTAPPPRQPVERPEGNDDGFLGGGISGSLLVVLVLGGGGTARGASPSRPPNPDRYQ